VEEDLYQWPTRNGYCGWMSDEWRGIGEKVVVDVISMCSRAELTELKCSGVEDVLSVV